DLKRWAADSCAAKPPSAILQIRTLRNGMYRFNLQPRIPGFLSTQLPNISVQGVSLNPENFRGRTPKLPESVRILSAGIRSFGAEDGRLEQRMKLVIQWLQFIGAELHRDFLSEIIQHDITILDLI